MKETKAKALLGPHEKYKDDWKPYEIIFRNLGYDVDVATSVDKMLDSLKNHYDLVLMEIDQGFPFQETYEPALTIYRHLEADVNAGRTRLLAISEMRGLAKSAKSAGIPAMSKDDFDFYELRELVKESKLKSLDKQYHRCEKSAPIADAL